MSLDPTYLEYKRRRRGMDQDLYPWSNINDRPPIAWPSGKGVAVALFVNLEWFPITPADKPFRAPGHMQTAYPDFRHYTAREYGTRIGFYRMLDAFATAGARATIAVNAAIAERYPSIIADIVAGGHEIVAHSTDMNGTIATGIDEDVERRLIQDSLDTLERVSGTRPRGWQSIARSQSWNTPRLLTEAGVTYMCDWVNDDLPYEMATPAGSIINVPVNHELSDRQIITVQQQSADSFAEQIRDAYALFADESVRGGRMLTIQLTPYVMGLPFRISALETLLEWLARQPQAWFASTGDIVDGIAGVRN
ncbi:polysaccharide deacetylase [Sphingopyxis lindanitolerans]|uniref:Chitooligosaccharide deacetylase n=1 Tax=Sphingopyxis lindanitolerans TaxID=2054227 RepID=A0A2S8B9G1_9SPHN|nr:polysaccharide deacetylase family protein [Sphingopyxis lindanitolerans]PQM29055.1 polysaccharide deacetylase [Sphingopyxis lindanitolerans]